MCLAGLPLGCSRLLLVFAASMFVCTATGAEVGTVKACSGQSEVLAGVQQNMHVGGVALCQYGASPRATPRPERPHKSPQRTTYHASPRPPHNIMAPTQHNNASLVEARCRILRFKDVAAAMNHKRHSVVAAVVPLLLPGSDSIK